MAQKGELCQSIKKYQKVKRTCYRTVPITIRQIFSGCLILHLLKEAFKGKILYVSFILKGSSYDEKL